MTCEKKYNVNTQCHGQSSYKDSYNSDNDEMMTQICNKKCTVTEHKLHFHNVPK